MENFWPLVISVPVKTVPATMAITTAAMDPIQKDFIPAFLPRCVP